jgi:hypothetical protein
MAFGQGVSCSPLVREPLSAAAAQEQAEVFKALSDPSGCGCSP